MTGHSLSAPGVRCSTMVELLRHRAEEMPERTAYTFLRDGEVEEAPLTYAALDRQARAIAAWLQEQGAAGERALLLFPPGLEFVSAFFGCLYAGVVAVPAYPPRVNRPDPRIREIVSDAQAILALTTSAVWSGMEPRLSEKPALAGLRWLATDSLAGGGSAEHWPEPAVDGRTLAFLQYTSGSTLTPKGVMVSHENVLQNLHDIRRTMQHGPDSVSVSWLPHFHDMGLVWGILQPLYTGSHGYLMPPASFLQRPVRWLQAVSKYKATHSGGPNFAYDLCATRVTSEQRSALDLRAWSVAFNGAEPVHQATLERFAEMFRPCGFRGKALRPCYGMAEATLMVSFSRSGAEAVALRARTAELEHNRVVAAAADDENARVLVGCGRAEGVRRMVIVDPQTSAAVAPDEIGEIWVSGPGIARGYWNRPEQTMHTFAALLADGAGPFLRTGDLGFVRDDELFITGRLKDLIIIRGLNHYPQDIEHTVERSHPALRLGGGAAFSVEGSQVERLVIVQEVDRLHQRKVDLEEVTGAIRRAVTEEHEVEPHAIVLIRHATILKTSSGKIQRQACRAAFLAGNLTVVGEWRKPELRETTVEVASGAPRTASDITGWLLARLARESGIEAEEIDLAQPFASFGLDSARSLTLIGDLETWLGRRLSPVLLWNYPTVEALARHLGA